MGGAGITWLDLGEEEVLTVPGLAAACATGLVCDVNRESRAELAVAEEPDAAVAGGGDAAAAGDEGDSSDGGEMEQDGNAAAAGGGSTAGRLRGGSSGRRGSRAQGSEDKSAAKSAAGCSMDFDELEDDLD